jgi:hypothetical protein
VVYKLGEVGTHIAGLRERMGRLAIIKHVRYYRGHIPRNSHSIRVVKIPEDGICRACVYIISVNLKTMIKSRIVDNPLLHPTSTVALNDRTQSTKSEATFNHQEVRRKGGIEFYTPWRRE